MKPLKSWKTLLAGISMVVTGITLITQAEYAEGMGMVGGGIGLIFAKDNNVTGGTVKQ